MEPLSIAHSLSLPVSRADELSRKAIENSAQQIYIKSERRLSQSRTRLKTYLICLNQIQASRRSAVCSCGLINNGDGQNFRGSQEPFRLNIYAQQAEFAYCIAQAVSLFFPVGSVRRQSTKPYIPSTALLQSLN